MILPPARILPIFLSEVKARFRAEFINRVDEQIVFRPLSEEDARRILRPMLDAISEELRGEDSRIPGFKGSSAGGIPGGFPGT